MSQDLLFDFEITGKTREFRVICLGNDVDGDYVEVQKVYDLATGKEVTFYSSLLSDLLTDLAYTHYLVIKKTRSREGGVTLSGSSRRS